MLLILSSITSLISHLCAKDMNKPLNHLAWVTTRYGKVLHCVPDAVDETGRWPDAFLDTPGARGTALCGKQTTYYASGVFTRLGFDRCKACCRRLKIPAGKGTPLNAKVEIIV